MQKMAEDYETARLFRLSDVLSDISREIKALPAASPAARSGLQTLRGQTPVFLDPNRYMDQAERGRRYARNAACLANRDGANPRKGLAHLAGKATDGVVVHPLRDCYGFSGLQLFYGLLLLDRKSVV